jgi:hypothetical protein
LITNRKPSAVCFTSRVTPWLKILAGRNTLKITTVPGIKHEVPDPTWVAAYERDTGGRRHSINWNVNYLNGTVMSRNGKERGLGRSMLE